MNKRCEIWDQAELFATGAIIAFVGEREGTTAIVERDDGWLMRIDVNCCKIIAPQAPVAQESGQPDLAAAIPTWKERVQADGEQIDNKNYNYMLAEIAELRAALATQPSAPQATGEQPEDARVDAIVTGLYRRFKDWSKRGFGPDDVTWCEVKADVMALVGAPQESAPYAPITLANLKAGKLTAARVYVAYCELKGELEAANGAIERYQAQGAPQESGELAKLREALQALYNMTSRYAISDTDYGIVCHVAAVLRAALPQDLNEEGK